MTILLERSTLITLDEQMLDWADNVACIRRGMAWQKRRKNHNNLTGNFDKLFALDRLGARCEVAGKIYLNPIKWNPISEVITGLPDLENERISVDVKGRSSSYEDLIVQKDDEEEWAFLLVRELRAPQYKIMGWAWGREAKQQRFWGDKAKNGRPAYFVPQEHLRAPNELLALTHPQRDPVLA